jgi:hypothetical protein
MVFVGTVFIRTQGALAQRVSLRAGFVGLRRWYQPVSELR